MKHIKLSTTWLHKNWFHFNNMLEDPGEVLPVDDDIIDVGEEDDRGNNDGSNFYCDW